MAWCFEDEATAAADVVLGRLADEEAHVPPLWRLEVANVLLVAERGGRLTEAQVARFLTLLQQLPIRHAPEALGSSTVLAIGRRYGLSAYDAEYLALAEQLALPLATLDRNLLAASQRAGVPCLIATE